MPFDSTIQEIYSQSHTFSLSNSIKASLNSATLKERTLQFVGSLVQYYKPATIFEFGGGISTKVLANASRTYTSTRLFSVDHSPFYLQKTKYLVSEAKHVTFFLCPITLYYFRWKGFATYDSAYIRQIPQGTKLDLVLIDGPSGRRFGREAPLYQLAPFLTPQTLILLDDSNRVPEKQSIANWQRVWPGGIDIVQFSESGKGFSILQIKIPHEMRRFPFRVLDIVDSWPKAIKRMLGIHLKARK